VKKDLTIQTIDEAARWDEFVAMSPQGSVFSSSRWLDAAADAQGGEPVILAVLKNGEIVAGVTFLSIVRGVMRKATSPAATPYGGILFRPPPGKRASEAESFNLACAELIRGWLERRYHTVFLVHTPALEDVRPFTWSGWSAPVRYTYLLDIADTDALWGLFERRVRTVIRNAESSLTLSGPVDIETFAVLYERIYGDRGRSLPFQTRLIKRLASRVLQEDFAEMRTVLNDDGEVISAMILVFDDRSVYSWISGSLPGENASGAFSLLFWDAINRHSGTRPCLDMIGANIDSIAFFKKGFGGTLTPYYVTEWYSSGLTKAAARTYTWVSRFIRHKS